MKNKLMLMIANKYLTEFNDYTLKLGFKQN